MKESKNLTFRMGDHLYLSNLRNSLKETQVMPVENTQYNKQHKELENSNDRNYYIKNPSYMKANVTVNKDNFKNIDKNMLRNFKQGDIVYVNFGSAMGCEQGGVRPAIIIQNNIGNYHSPTLLVAPITSKPKKLLPTHYFIRQSVGGLSKNESTILFEQTRVIDKCRLCFHKPMTHINFKDCIPQFLAAYGILFKGDSIQLNNVKTKYYNSGNDTLKNLKQGDIILVNLNNGVGSEQGGISSAVILQNNTGNYFAPTLIIAPISIKPKKLLPTHYLLPETIRLSNNASTVLFEQTRVIDKSRVCLVKPLAHIHFENYLSQFLMAFGIIRNKQETIRLLA